MIPGSEGSLPDTIIRIAPNALIDAITITDENEIRIQHHDLSIR